MFSEFLMIRRELSMRSLNRFKFCWDMFGSPVSPESAYIWLRLYCAFAVNNESVILIER
jgi:hypothetical protein